MDPAIDDSNKPSLLDVNEILSDLAKHVDDRLTRITADLNQCQTTLTILEEKVGNNIKR